MAKTWTIQYRQGGTERFRWVRTRAFSSYTEACGTRNDLERAGYLAHLWPTEQIAIAGYPTGYTSDDKRNLVERGGWMVPAPAVIPELDDPEYQDGLFETFPDCA